MPNAAQCHLCGAVHLGCGCVFGLFPLVCAGRKLTPTAHAARGGRRRSGRPRGVQDGGGARVDAWHAGAGSQTVRAVHFSAADILLLMTTCSHPYFIHASIYPHLSDEPVGCETLGQPLVLRMCRHRSTGPVVGATTDRMYLLSPTMMFFQVGGDCGGHVPRLDRRDTWGGQHGSAASRVVPAMKATN